MKIEVHDVDHGACIVCTSPTGHRLMIDCGRSHSRPWSPSAAYRGQRIDTLLARVDSSNRTYGMFRGISAALLGCLAWIWFAHPDNRLALGLIAAAFMAAVYRMRRTGQHYARALVLDFVDLPAAAGGKSKPKS